MRDKHKVIAMILSVIMVFAMAPCVAFANEAADQDVYTGSLLAETDTPDSVPIKINFGAKHKAMAKKVYQYTKKLVKEEPEEYKTLAPKLKGAVLTLYGNLPAVYVGPALMSLISECGYEMDQNYYGVHDAGEIFNGAAAAKPISYFNTFDEYMEFVRGMQNEMVKKNQTVNLYWFTPVPVNVNVTVDAPICGTEVSEEPLTGYQKQPVQINGPVVSVSHSSYIYAPATEKYSAWMMEPGTITGGRILYVKRLCGA